MRYVIAATLASGVSPRSLSRLYRRGSEIVTALGTTAITLAVLSASPALAQDYNTEWVEPGKSVLLYWNLNLSGKVFVAADTNGNAACLDYWWKTIPLFITLKLGRHCGRASFDLPGLSNFAAGGGLYAGGADQKTRLRGTSQERVAHDFPEISF